MRGKLLAILASVFISGASKVEAQDYPSRPITMIVPFAAGGPTDSLARLVAEALRMELGQSVVIENGAGAGGRLAIARAARAAPDGYTINIGSWGTHVIAAAVHSMPYDLLRDFEPIALVASNPHLIVSKTSIPAANLTDLIAWLKENQGRVSGANSGAGSSSHASGLLFQQKTGIQFPFVPYRGAGPILQDLITGQIDLYFDQASSALSHVRAGRIRAYAVTASSRLPIAPDIPTVDEAGLKEFYVSVWHGLWAPRGTPRDVVLRLNEAVVKVLGEPSFRERLAVIGQIVYPRDQQTPEALENFHQSEIEKWWPIIKAANIKVE
jgi:tripartite-type tricarboxylate transporter receptor subunit TctC